MKLTLSVLSLLFLQIGCGAPDDSHAVAIVTPDLPSVRAGDTVALVGTLTQVGRRTRPASAWWIKESTDLNSKNLCSKFDTDPKELTECPFGYLIYHSGWDLKTNATYYAPQTPGTYHVVLYFGWLNMEWLETSTTVQVEVTP